MEKNTLWSKQVQSISQLDNSRNLKFREDRKDLYLHILNLKPGMVIADIGCGPGTLTRKLAKWLGKDTRVIGIDRDSTFIEFAREKASSLGLENQVDYIQGDALCIPLDDNSVDAVTSHTVIEHVENEGFLKEKMRICKPGGRVSVQSVRVESKIITNPEDTPAVSKREEELWDLIEPAYTRANKTIGVAKYGTDPLKLPKLFEKLGFINIQIDTITFPMVVDDDRNTIEEKKKMLKMQETEIKEAAINGYHMLGDQMSKAALEELLSLIHNRYQERLNLVDAGKKLWDYEISPLFIVSGEVKKAD